MIRKSEILYKPLHELQNKIARFRGVRNCELDINSK